MLAAITIILNMVCRSYTRNSARNSTILFWIVTCLNSLVSILLNVTIWEFSWQLFNVSVEVDEKICRTKHKLTKRVRKAVEIVVVVLIGIS
jgi:regulatory protein YycH of two-component signal transduction system YycFG